MGGVERVTDVLAKQLRSMGQSVHFLCFTDRGSPIDQGRCAAPQHLIDITKHTEEEAVRLYVQLLKDYAIDTVIFQMCPQNFLFLSHTPEEVKRISAFHGQPFPNLGIERKVLKSAHPLGLVHKLSNLFYQAFPIVLRKKSMKQQVAYLTKYATHSDLLCLLSERFIPRVLKYCPGIESQKVCAINNPNTFQAEQTDDGEKENLVVLVARIENSQKNVLQFIDVWKQVETSVSTWKAIVVGDGPDFEYTWQYATAKGLKNLSFVGNQSDVSSFYRKAKILCLTSFGEGWGMVLTEAMAYGTVPVAFDSYESLHDIITDGESGKIVKAFDTQSMANSLIQIMNNEGCRRRMAENSRKKIEQFQADAIAEQWINTIMSIKK